MTDSHDTTNPSSRPCGSDSGRLSDLDHIDELGRMKVRLRALSVSAESALTGDAEVLSGFHQLLVDVADAMTLCAKAFEAEHTLRRQNKGGARG